MNRARIAAVAASLIAVVLAPAHASRPVETVVKPYTFAPAPTLCSVAPTTGGACFDIPEARRHFHVVAWDSVEHYVRFRLLLLDEAGLPIAHMPAYGEHCGWTPVWIEAPSNARALVVEVAEPPAFMPQICPHVSDDGEISVTFARPVGRR